MLKFGSKGENSVVYKCTVRLLEDTEILECEYKAHHKGKYLLEIVCKQLNLIEQDYLGLRYVDSMDQRHWLDMAKSIVKQIKDIDPVLFSFRVKFYPPDPFRLKEEITRYQMFLQLKRDLLHGRLYCTVNECAQLGALIVQSEIGDYDPEIQIGNYVSEYKLLLKQTEAIEDKIMEIHQKQLKGQSPSQAENFFLRVACQLDTYGIDPHPVKDHRGNQLYLGINYSGILTFQGSRKTHHFRWPDIQKINYEGKMFIIHLNYNDKKHTVGFKCSTGAACRHVWRCAIEQMLFFTLPTSSDAPSVVTGGGFFSWGTKFKYTGRTEREILEDMAAPTREEPAIQRTSSLRRKASSVPATPSTPLQPHLGYSSLPRSSHSDAGGSRMETSSSAGVLSNIDGVNFNDNIALLETVSEDQEAGSGKSRIQGVKDDLVDHFNEYYFRDSFEHSSSESQLVDSSYKGYEAQSHRSSRSQTPLGHGQGTSAGAGAGSGAGAGAGSGTGTVAGAGAGAGAVDTRLCVPIHHGSFYTSAANQPHPSRKFSIVKVFVPSLVFVLLLVAFLTVVMLETDCELFGSLRSIPEMISLRYQYYEPWKQYLQKQIPTIF